MTLLSYAQNKLHSKLTEEYLLILEVSRELIALRERSGPLDGLLLSLLTEDGLRVLQLGSSGPLRPRLDPVAVEWAVKSVGADG